jgi:hypothetical protein
MTIASHPRGVTLPTVLHALSVAQQERKWPDTPVAARDQQLHAAHDVQPRRQKQFEKPAMRRRLAGLREASKNAELTPFGSDHR